MQKVTIKIFYSLFYVIFLGIFLTIKAIVAESPNKSGVSPQILSLPSGPGAVEGLGESFEPQLNTGTASYAVPLKAAPGRAGFAPQLVLRYNGGWGNGALGMGWRLDLPGIQRQTDKGLPRYDDGPDGDHFITIGGDELVLVETLDAGAVRVYREKNEATFSKYLYYPGAQRWEILTTSGIKHALGTCFDGTATEARIMHPDNASNVFLWSIAESMDPNGNTVRFTYHRDQHQVYCEAITYNDDGSGASGNTMKVAFTYEDTRPDPVEDYRPTFRMVTAKRLIAVGVYENTLLVRRYDLAYHSDGEVSLLASVTQVGDDGASALPPASFTYTSLAFAATPTLKPVSGLGGAFLLRDGQNGDDFPGAAQVIDFNADGLPDLYASKHGGSDRFEFDLFYRNLGKGRFERVALSEAESAGYPIQAQNSFLRDLTGNGRVDLIAQKGGLSENFVYKTNEGGKWSAKEHPFQLLGGVTAEHVFTGDEVRSADLDFDKNIDTLRSWTAVTASGTGVVFSAYFYRGDGRFEHVAQTMTDIVPGLSTTFAASNGRLLLSDMNGDRMLDLVLLSDATNGGVRWWPSLGRGRFEPVAGGRTMRGGPDYGDVNDQMSDWQVEDINGDGYADLVGLTGYSLEVYLNRAGQGYTDKQAFNLGVYYNPEATAWRLVDVDGDGVLELLLCTGQQQFPDQMPVGFHYVELFEGDKSFLLKTITNGIGLTTTLTYSSSVAEMVRAREAGSPWKQWAPFPVPVVTRTEVFDGVNAPYVTEITYQDAYYDGLEREFRGFAAATQRELGDSSLPDLFTDHIFDTGVEYEVLKGKTLSFEARAAEKSGDNVFYREDLTWEARKLLDGAPGETRVVNFAAQTARERTITEQGRGTPVTLRWEYDYDAYGNRTWQQEFGRLDGAWDDERVTETTYTAADASGLSAWILNKVVTQTTKDENGVLVAEKRSYYDDLPLGQVSKGNLTEEEDWVAEGNYVASVRNTYDAYGNIIRIEDALFGSAPGHYRELIYDDTFHTFPVKEIIHTGNGASPLTMTAAYDYGFGVMTSSTEFNGFTTTYGYDTFGRLTSITKPPDTGHTVEYDYVLAHDLGGGHIINWVETRQRNPQSNDPQSAIRNPQFLCSRTYHDGLGRKVMTRTDSENAGEVVVSDTVVFNARKQPWKKYLPYIETGGLDYVDPTYNSGCTTHYYDALGREIRMDQPDGSYSQTAYAPLEKTVYDEEQTNPASPHAGCGMRYVEDGLQDKDGKGRLREVYEGVKLKNNGEPGALTWWPTRYTYDLLDNFTGYTDSQGNQKFIEYDGLGRKTFMNDPDRGHMYYEYDDAGNLVRTTDAKDQVIRYAYDGVNRLLAEYYGADTTKPDVEYHYDTAFGPVALGEYWEPTPDRAVSQAILEGAAAASPDLDLNKDHQVDVADAVLAARAGNTKSQPVKTAENVRGYLAWVRDQSGEEHNSYDARGRVAWTIKRIQDTGPEDLRNFYTGYDYDSMDRVTTLTYPDQTTVSYIYNARGLLEAIPNVVTRVDYNPAGQNARLDYACGTSTTYDYDTRLRLSRLRTVRPRDGVTLQDLNYTYDGVSNITAITDSRTENDYQVIGNELGITLEESKKFDNTQAFQYDSLYRLTQSSNTDVYGTISHRYDPIGNMVKQIAELNDSDPLMNLGAMTSGGTGGTSGRIGRGPADQPGPHAITGTEKGPDGAMAFTYDANGNMTSDRDMSLSWDHKDRLAGITKASVVADYQYDFTDTRKKKSIPGEASKTVFYVDKNSEVREGELHKYVYVGMNRVARMDPAFDLQPSAFYLHDHLGSTVFTLNAGVVVTEQQVNYPFGYPRKECLNRANYYAFTGKEHDIESGLYFFESRYRHSFSMFCTVDNFAVEMPVKWLGTPQFLNSYSYTLNRPVVFIDMLGNEPNSTVQNLLSASLQVRYSERGSRGYYHPKRSPNGGFDCVTYVLSVLKAAGISLDRDTTTKAANAGMTAEQYRQNVKNNSDKAGGVAHALIEKGLGKPVHKDDLQVGDLVQYNLKDGSGHTGIVSEVNRDGTVNIRDFGNKTQGQRDLTNVNFSKEQDYPYFRAVRLYSDSDSIWSSSTSEMINTGIKNDSE